MRALVALVLIAAAYFRFHDLGLSAVRSDELNFLNRSLQNQSIVEFWENPPWLNQIPFAETIAILWSRVRPGVPDEGSVREPFAFLGLLTVAGCLFWSARRFGLFPALLAGIWLALLPLHVYHSREAYYYTPAIFFSAGMAGTTVDRALRLLAGTPLRARDVLVWLAWALPACHSHMSVWVFAGVNWLFLLVAGWRGLNRAARGRHIAWMAGVGVLTLIVLSRWIARAVQEVINARKAAGVLSDTGHIGGAMEWVAPRVLPMFVGGYNIIGFGLLLLILASAAFAWRGGRTNNVGGDSTYRLTAGLVWLGLLVTFAYVAAIGRGSAKISFFCAVLPPFLVWSAATIDRAMARLPEAASRAARGAVFALVTMALVYPAWQVTQLTGRPVPYRELSAMLDALLPPGSVAIVDRWFEPWNEMARYRPAHVAVTFTVPDEPFDTYTRLRWRDVTRARIEAGGIDAFIRLARNHEERIGLWTWPETWFAHRAVVENPSAIWLRDHGYAPEQDYDMPNDRRVRVEIFYNTREDAVRRAIEVGRPFPVFFGADLPYEKSGPMGFLRFRTQQFHDWRVLGAAGTVEIVNPTTESRSVVLDIQAISPSSGKFVGAPPSFRFHFPQNQFASWPLGPIELKPGVNVIRLSDVQSPQSPAPLFIADIRVHETNAEGK